MYLKTQAVLYMYDTLLKTGSFKREFIEEQLNIGNLTFHRYVEELRAYFTNFNAGYDVIYDRTHEIYRLTKY